MRRSDVSFLIFAKIATRSGWWKNPLLCAHYIDGHSKGRSLKITDVEAGHMWSMCCDGLGLCNSNFNNCTQHEMQSLAPKRNPCESLASVAP